MNDQLEITSRERTTFTRREFVAGAAGAMAVSLIPAVARAGAGKPSTGDITMSRGYIKTKDGVDIFYKDWGPKSAQPIVFHHGWPLSSDDWDAQMLFFHSHGYRVVAHDRRGHRSEEHTSELQSLMRISYAVFCLKKKKNNHN